MESPVGDGPGAGPRKHRRIREKSGGEASAQASQVENHRANTCAECIAGRESTPGPYTAAKSLGGGEFHDAQTSAAATQMTGAFSLLDFLESPRGIVVTSLS